MRAVSRDDTCEERAGLPAGADAETVSEATNELDGGRIFHDGWRYVVWAIFCVGIVYFYMFMMRNPGFF